tara:strand:- start:80 stop:295 length:216 start_codon:yes stop_codon:yes gene_type:complete
MTTKTAKGQQATTNNKMQLFKRLEETKARTASLEQALGRIRSDIMNLTFPGSHRETVDNVIKIVDNIIKSV